MAPTISVVIPAYNSEKLIPRAIASVLGQTDLPEELLVVDDGSRDGTAAAVEACRSAEHGEILRLIRQKNGGPGAARNTGIREARGEWIAFLDNDDWWEPRKIEKVRDRLRAREDLVIVSHDCFVVRPNGGKPEVQEIHRYFDPARPAFPQLFRGNFLVTSATAVRRSAALECGGFDPAFLTCDDYDLWLKLARQGGIEIIPEPLESYYLRAGSLSSRTCRRCREVEEIYRRNLPYLLRYMEPDRARRFARARLTAQYGAEFAFAVRQGGAGQAIRAMGQYPGALGRLRRAWAGAAARTEKESHGKRD